MDDILTVIFAIAVLGHGAAHAVATVNLGRQVAGRPGEGVITVRTPLLPNLSDAASAGLAFVFWLPASLGFIVAVPAMLNLFLDDLPWSATLVAAALISIGGIALFTGIWPGGEARLRVLHVALAVGMDLIIIVTQLVLGWPAA
ncbi:MAG: hypothetical protein PVH07_09750 [Chloroflexota bacterium]|jgi:hypothetical protein